MTLCTALVSRARRFLSEEDGTSLVPFAIWTPLVLILILSTIELGTVTIRNTALERAMDDSVRDLRIGTGTVTDHATLKAAICESAAVLPDCTDNLQLEMVALDMRDWTAPPSSADCVDTALPVTPNRAFQNGTENEMMLLRACFKYRPVTPAGTIASHLATDNEGFTAIVATSAFVHEPL
ncbi:TadE/TadG family type IV pilus assembly protein [Cognatishimia sp. F0-27]|uniref:TadE/TadG family type IV pilus assembly protein n=1 Tax=Cognatishimia sp. F0-27 TaxID=2816855 RepID=UPI001D0C6EE5|nr:TadE family protein [Cognatishimia sp. F0-27]MCC1491712.1 pilus assembly protein [Cognatishimia sp. F0-27]